ncbi:MAG: hypothetical protein Ct9H300mP3_03120 [Gammaproteobacteria bacterium]|nr:MAG: hypothetical protein Ct9H300mP3_03120 [Gammaproteobacteria bacterium]
MLKASEIKVGDTHSEVLVEDLKRTQIVQYAGLLAITILYTLMRYLPQK